MPDLHSSGSSPSAAPRRDGTIALLVIHGIGNQRPYETLDAFARGLATALPAAKPPFRLRTRRVGEETVTSLRLRLTRPFGDTGATALDLYELYWAGKVQGRIGLRQVLAWIARTSLTPLRTWSTRWTVLRRRAAAARQAAAPAPAEAEGGVALLPLLLRELGRALLLPAVVLLLAMVLVWALQHARSVGEMLRSLSPPATAGAAAGALLLILLATAVVLILKGWLALALRGEAVGGDEARRLWRRGSGAMLVVLVAAGFLVLRWPPISPAAWFAQMIPTREAGLALLCGVLALAGLLWLRWFLVEFVGDIALYVTSDERSEFYRTRADILAASTARLRWLLEDPAYAAVFVAGHSLGSVIAYDTLNRLTRQVRADSGHGAALPAWYARLRGLLTFGSPLDRVDTFFRARVPPHQEVRAQILALLHGFHRPSAPDDASSFTILADAVSDPPGFRWLNVSSPFDPISGSLALYAGVRQVSRRFRRFWRAHLEYWNDPRFYAEVRAWLAGNGGPGC